MASLPIKVCEAHEGQACGCEFGMGSIAQHAATSFVCKATFGSEARHQQSRKFACQRAAATHQGVPLLPQHAATSSMLNTHRPLARGMLGLANASTTSRRPAVPPLTAAAAAGARCAPSAVHSRHGMTPLWCLAPPPRASGTAGFGHSCAAGRRPPAHARQRDHRSEVEDAPALSTPVLCTRPAPRRQAQRRR